MYDAVTAANILNHDETPELVAGYVDRIKLAPWTADDWALFPGATKVRIVKKAATNDGHVLDVEPGDATPAEAPGWVLRRRAAGADPSVYMNSSTWPAVRAAFQAARVAEPHYWVAQYDGDPDWPAGWAERGCVAKQYRGNYRGVDLSSVADYWPGVDQAPTNGGAAASSTGVELMERRTLTKSATTRGERLLLPGGPNCKLIVRPPAEGTKDAPVWLGDVFAWASAPGQTLVGIGEQYNPNKIGGYNKKVTLSREIPLPNAVWCDFNYSCGADFVVDIVG